MPAPRAALALLTAVVVLAPATLALPTGFTGQLTVVRLTALAVGLYLLTRSRPALWRSTPLHLPVGLLALTTAVTGVLLVGPELPAGRAFGAWADLMTAVLVGVVALACARAAGPTAALASLAGVALVAVALAAVEHVTGHAVSRLVGGFPLETRAGQTRVRVGSDFALAFAWTMAALTPSLVALLRRRVPLSLLALAGGLAAGYWTFSRSVPLGFALGLVLLAVGLRDRRTVAVLLVAAAGVGLLAVGVPSVRHRFTTGVDQGAIVVRTERAPVVLEAASRHPVAGLGLTGVHALQVGETDDSYLLSYAETGVLGIVALLGVLALAVVLIGRGLRGPPGPARALCSAALAGTAVLAVAGGAFDAFAVRGTADLLALLIGVGLAGAEVVSGPAAIARPLRDLPLLRVTLVLLAVGGGLLVREQAPTHVVQVSLFSTLSPTDLTPSFDKVDAGRRLVATVCAVATQDPPAGVSLDCRDDNTGPGIGVLRVQAASSRELTAALFALGGRVRAHTAVKHLTGATTGPPLRGKDTVWQTAPWWAGAAALLLALVVPSQPLRRLEARSRRWSWTVDRGELLADDVGADRSALGIGEQRLQGRAEPGEVAELQGVAR